MGLVWIGEKSEVTFHAKLCLIFLLAVGAFFTSPAAAQQNQDEAQLLLSLKNNFTDPRGSLGDWSPSTPLCNWTGISCAANTTSGHLVSGISLPRKSLQGEISSALGLLQGLRVLDLSRNNLTGPIPPDITRCTALTDINLSENSLTGVIPGDIGKLAALTNLRLSGNELQGPIPTSVGRLIRLKRLNVDNNRLNGSIPREIGNCTELKFFQAYTNELTGNIPVEIGKLKKLSHLSLFQNRLSGGIPEEISGCTSLSRVSLANNDLTGPFPRLGNVTGLFELDVSNNRLSGELPEGLGGSWKQLDSLRMGGNEFTGALPRSFGGMAVLRELNLSWNGFGGQLPVNLGPLPLVVLSLVNNSFQGPLPPLLGSVGGGLQVLDVSRNQFTGGLPSGLCSGQNLTLVNVSRNMLSGEFSQLSNCSSLQSLTASGNAFNGTFPMLFTSSSLKFLDLSSNQFQGPVSPRIDELGALRSLLLGNNRLSGSLPHEIGLLPLLEALNVSGNVLGGELPNLSSLTSLHLLDLSFNGFTGNIPQDLGTFTMLETLDVSNNEFSGSIPPTLTRLTELKAYNFSNNRLSGQIPQIKASMPASAFANNAELCGPPLARPCDGSTLTPPPTRTTGTRTTGKRNRRRSVARKVGLAFLIIGGALLAITASFLLYTYRALKKNSSRQPVAGQVENKFADRVPLLYAEIEKATEGFSDANVIGAGPHGAVYKGIFAWEKILAVKVIRSEQEVDNDNNKNTYYYTAAARKLNRIRHPNVVKLEEFVIYKGVKIFLYEYMPNKSLGEVLHRPSGPKLHWNTRYKIALGAAQGLSYLHHQQSIVHCDIKSTNFLLDSAFGARIADVGIAKLIKDSRNLACLNKSLGYTAPEAAKVSQKADVFSFGVVLLELLTGRHPVLEDGSWLGTWVRECVADDLPLSDIVDPILRNVNGPFQEEMSTVCKVALICTDPSPSRRPSMKQVVEVLSRIRKEPGGPKLRSLRSFIHSRSFVLLSTRDEDQL